MIFEGTYDEHNWKVLRDRWDDLRAQLHGVIVPQGLAVNDDLGQNAKDDISKATPDFSPTGMFQDA